MGHDWRVTATLMGIVAALGCGVNESLNGQASNDAPGGQAVDGLTAPPQGAGPRLRGTVSLGRPVSVATVTLRALDGTTIASSAAQTNADGAFDLRVTAPLAGGLIIVQAGGTTATYRELTDGAQRTFDADDTLSTVVLVEGQDVLGVQVNAITTLVTALMRAYAVSQPNPVSLANQRLALHVLRPAGYDPATTPVVDLSAGPSGWPAGKTAQGLLHAGLAGIARTMTQELGATVATIDLVQALAVDLRDGVFDGKRVDGSVALLAGKPLLDADTTRGRLAAETDRLVSDPAWNRSGLTYDQLADDTGFYTLVSTDDGPLYPPGPVRRYDARPPTVTFTAPEAESWQSGPFTVSVLVKDVSPLQSIVLLEPVAGAGIPTLDLATGTLSVTIDPHVLTDGPLPLVARATDVSNNAADASRGVRLDTTAPLLTASFPALFASADTPVTGLASDDGSGLALLEVTSAGTTAVVTVQPDGTFTHVPSVAPGVNVVTVRAKDLAGNVTERQLAGTYDLAVPTIQVISPAPGSFVGPSPVTLVLAVADASGVASVEATVGQDTTPGALSDGVWTVTTTPPGADGPFEVTVKVLDGAGNPTEATFPYVRDGTPPAFASVLVTGGSTTNETTFVATAQATVVATVVDGGGSGVSSVCSTSPCDGQKGLGDVWTVVVPAPGDVTLLATDGVQNMGTVALHLVRDETPPSCVLKNWVGAATQLQQVLFEATLDDGSGSGTASAAYTVDGQANVTVAAMSGMGAALLTLPEGPHQVSATCADAVGNVATSNVVNVTVDLTAPKLSAITPAANAWVGDLVTLTFTVEDLSALISVTVAGQGFSSAAKPNANGSYSATFTAPSAATFVVDITAVDAAGHTTVVQHALKHDLAPPVLGAIVAKNGVKAGATTYVAGSQVLLEVTATDAESGVASVCVGAVCDTSAAGGYVVTGPVGVSLAALVVTVTDGVGRTASKTLEVVQDTTPPTCAVSVPDGGFWFAKTPVTLSGATADGAGVGGILVTAASGVVTTMGGVQGAGWAASLALKADDASDVVVTCTDALGNAAEALVKVYVDTKPPDLGLATTKFQDEATKEASWDGTAVKYLPEIAPAISLPNSCEPAGSGVFDCKVAFSKYTSLLAWPSGSTVATQNSPVFLPKANDNGSAIPESEIALDYQFQRVDGTPLMAYRAVPTIEGKRQVPIAVPFLTDESPAAFQWATTKLPARIAIRATDRAKNSTTVTWKFAMSLRAPPVFLEDVASNGKLPNANAFALTDANAVQLFGSGGPLAPWGGPTVARFRVFNPHPVGTALSFTSTTTLKVTFSGQRAFLRTQLKTVPYDDSKSACKFAHCLDYENWVSWAAKGPSYCAPEVSPETTKLETVLAADLRLYAKQGDTAALVPTDAGYVVLAAGAEAVLAVVMQSNGTCLLAAPSAVNWTPKGGSQAKTSYTYVAPEAIPTCALPAFPSQKDTTVSNAHTWECTESTYASAKVVTKVDVALDKPTSGGLKIAFAFKVPTFTAQSTSSSTIKPVAWSTASEAFSSLPYHYQ